MKRKLVRQGSSTMMISLPSKWVKNNNLDKGDEVDIEEKDNSILISTTKIVSKKEIILEINESNKKDIKNLLTHIYRFGYNKIIVKGYKGTIKEIKTIVDELLMGFELTEVSSNHLVIENISEPEKEKYPVLLKKSFQIIEETQEIAIKDFEENSFKHLEDINDLKKQQDRFLLFCRRILVKNMGDKNTLTQWEIMNFLMHIEHRYYYLYEFAANNKITKNREIIGLLISLKNYFHLFSDAYFNKNLESIHKINSQKHTYYFGECIKVLEKSSGKNTVILAYIREIFRLIQIATSPIFNEIFDKNF